ncbi:hypothetical protein ZIOFF_036379 [Zingiber officinale]|uniref:Cyclin-like domain-containing protein n=1 Tax=Zingiber officinale TaxID=94328 RepID=A0A8J5KYJ5_ZINOF|nr:hypothetical protein ZIOFF_036379 [Zingiber officinale]
MFHLCCGSKQLLDPDKVDVVHRLDKEKCLTLEEFRLIKIHMSIHIWRLALHVKVRQRVIATAITYFRRVYTSFFDATLIGAGTSSSDEKYRFEIKDILEMEMKVLEALDYYLVVFHPYRPLLQLLQDANITDLTQVAWGLVNDTYKMDLILIHPPHMIALACIYIACVLKDKDLTSWFEELRADMNIVKNIAMEILEFFEYCRPDPKNNILLPEDRINAALNKVAAKP